MRKELQSDNMNVITKFVISVVLTPKALKLIKNTQGLVSCIATELDKNEMLSVSRFGETAYIKINYYKSTDNFLTPSPPKNRLLVAV